VRNGQGAGTIRSCAFGPVSGLVTAPIRCKLRGQAMALEFALRPRIDLERPTPQRRGLRLRLPRLTLPIVGYWLAVAGGTHLLLGVLEERPGKSAARTPVRARKAAALPPASLVPEGPGVAAPLSLVPGSDAQVAEARETDAAASAVPIRELAVESARAPAPSRTAKAMSAASEPFEFPPLALAARSGEPAPRAREPQAATAPEASEGARETLPAPRRDSMQEAMPTQALPSCESAAAAGNQSIDLRAAGGAPDLTRDAFAAILENGAYLGACAVPARTALEICAAVRDGKVVGVTVTTAPRDPAISACVRRAVAALHFPRNASLDVTRTRFESAAR
jgi:hypothetical protein